MCLGIQIVSYIFVIGRKHFTNGVLRILDLRYIEHEFRIEGNYDLEGIGMTINGLCEREGELLYNRKIYFSAVKTTYLIGFWTIPFFKSSSSTESLFI